MHASIVVLLDKAVDAVGEGGLGMRRHGGDDVCAQVAKEVEGGVDGEWEQGKEDGLAVQPAECHDWGGGGSGVSG